MRKLAMRKFRTHAPGRMPQEAHEKRIPFSAQCFSVMILLLLLLVLPAGHIQAAEYYVDLATGSDTHTGAYDAPWGTIQKAADTMSAGDRCTIRSGNYSERVEITRSGRSNAPIIFQAQASVMMQGFRFMNKADYIEISGFEIAHITNEYGSYEGGSGIYAKGEHCRFLNNDIHHISSVGIYVSAEPSNSSDVVIGHNAWYVQEPGFPYHNHTQWPGDIRDADPKFVKLTSDPETWDLHLQSNSPCIDAGTNLSGVVDEDMDNISRPMGDEYDMGAYENFSSSPLPPVGLVVLPQSD